MLLCRTLREWDRVYVARVLVILYMGVYCCAQPVSKQAGPFVQRATAPICRGLGRRAVDWWIMLKHPAGYQYSYIDSSIRDCSNDSCWRHRLTMLNPSPVGHTLALLEQVAASKSKQTLASDGAADVAYALYNDEDPPGVEHFESAHAKGVVAFSSVNHSTNTNSSYQGFWLVHSAPRFPRDPAEPGFAELAKAQSVFGQHFSCFSLAGKQAISAVAAMLLAAGPFIYSSSLPEQLAAGFPSWRQLLHGSIQVVPLSVSIRLQTAAGVQLEGFAKTKYLNVSLTDVVVAPGLFSSMLWETWRRSHDALPSFCPEAHDVHNVNQYSSLNIQRISFPNTPYTWPSLTDHSKWGISSSTWHGGSSVLTDDDDSEQQHIVCLGDMNRAWWQSRRGGGYVCVQHVGLWQAFSSIVAGVEACRGPIVT